MNTHKNISKKKQTKFYKTCTLSKDDKRTNVDGFSCAELYIWTVILEHRQHVCTTNSIKSWRNWD